MEFATLLTELVMVIIIAIAGVGAAVLWRTSIYTRGAIFRPIGRILDLWVYNGCKPTAGFWHKLLRFLAYPLGKCIYCSSIHIAYDVFFVISWAFGLGLTAWWLLILLPIVHLLIIIIMNQYVNPNTDLEKGDWDYMRECDKRCLIDIRRRMKFNSPLNKEEEETLECCKSGEFYKKES
jgi:hypothetical protein